MMRLLVRRASIVGTLLLVGISAAPTFQQGQLAVRDDPLSLFAELMPVLSHERWANCHGATDPFRGFYHPGAVPRNTPCVDCHTASHMWSTAPSVMAFFGKTTRQLCDHFAAFEPATNNFLEQHLQIDPLIQLAFIGRRGNAVGPEYTQTPPMSKAEFLRKFRIWVRDGGAACSGWEGTITEEQTIVGNAKKNALGGQMTHWQGGTRTLTITVKDGHATVSSQVYGYDNTRVVLPANNCTVSVYSQKLYRILGQSPRGPPPPPAPPAPGDTMPTPPPPPPVIAPGTVRVGIDAAGNYRIQVTPAGETIETTDYGHGENTCGTANPAPTQDTDKITWKPFVIDIFGTLPNPRDRRQLKDSREIVMTTDDTDRSMGIEVYGSASEIDGTPIPFRIKRSWDLRRLP